MRRRRPRRRRRRRPPPKHTAQRKLCPSVNMSKQRLLTTPFLSTTLGQIQLRKRGKESPNCFGAFALPFTAPLLPLLAAARCTADKRKKSGRRIRRDAIIAAADRTAGYKYRAVSSKRQISIYLYAVVIAERSSRLSTLERSPKRTFD